MGVQFLNDNIFFFVLRYPLQIPSHTRQGVQSGLGVEKRSQ